MKKYFLLCLVIAACWACSSTVSYKKAEDAQDAGREFIRASLDGDIDKARFYMVKDSFNLDMLDNKWKKNYYDKLGADERRQYREAQIRPVKIEQVNDSVVNYAYTNSYMQKDTTVINVVRVKGEWLVDFKHLQRWHQ